MENLMGIEEIKQRYRIRDEKTARRRMREIGALDTRPMLVTESAVTRWEAENIRGKPGQDEMKTTRRRSRGSAETIFGVKPVQPKPGQYISRVRPKAGGKAG